MVLLARMRRVLIITYYWPPAGGAGAQRVAKFCKYIGASGWDPVVLTVANGNCPVRDESLLDEVSGVSRVHAAPTVEPHVVYRALDRFVAKRRRGGKGEAPSGAGAPRALRRLGEYIRLNLFIPDSRVGWRANARRLGLELVGKESPSAIFSSAPPYTTHMVALDLSRATGLPWVADFRDPWLENHAYNTVPRLGIVRALNRRLERRVLAGASRVTCANPGLRELLAGKVEPALRDRFVSITNGYDAADARTVSGQGQHFHISYLGTIYSDGFPEELLSAIGGLVKEDPEFASAARFRVIGRVDPDVREKILEMVPEGNLEVRAHLPHDAFLELLHEPQVLVLVVNNVPTRDLIVPAKVYEYLPTGNPVLGVGPADGDAAKILRQTQVGRMFEYGDTDGARGYLADRFSDWKSGRLNRGSVRFPRFERANLAGTLARVLDDVTAT